MYTTIAKAKEAEEDIPDETSDSSQKNSPVRTVCNDTYTTTDTYLVPISNHKDDLDESENCNNKTPLLDKTVREIENESTKPENNNVLVNGDHVEPVFKKKLENSVPQSRFSRSKQTIYPAEQVTLLSDTGPVRCFETAEVIHHQETTIC